MPQHQTRHGPGNEDDDFANPEIAKALKDSIMSNLDKDNEISLDVLDKLSEFGSLDTTSDLRVLIYLSRSARHLRPNRKVSSRLVRKRKERYVCILMRGADYHVNRDIETRDAAQDISKPVDGMVVRSVLHNTR
jgi:hypothetical protein